MGRYSAKDDNGLSIDRVRCTHKTGHWLPLAPERPLCSVRMAEPEPKRKLVGSESRRSTLEFTGGQRPSGAMSGASWVRIVMKLQGSYLRP